MALALTSGPLAAPWCLCRTHPTVALPPRVALPWLAPTSLVLGDDNSKTPAKVLQDLIDDAAKDEISGLLAGDTNAFLYVGAGGAPTPVPTPAPPPGTWSVQGSGCSMSGNCIQSNNHPGNYGNNEACTIEASDVAITVDAFNTESGYDFLTMPDGTGYSGSSGPPSGTYSGTI